MVALHRNVTDYPTVDHFILLIDKYSLYIMVCTKIKSSSKYIKNPKKNVLVNVQTQSQADPYTTPALENRPFLLVTPSKSHYFLMDRFFGNRMVTLGVQQEDKNKRYLGVRLFFQGAGATFEILRYYYVYESFVSNCLVF